MWMLLKRTYTLIMRVLKSARLKGKSCPGQDRNIDVVIIRQCASETTFDSAKPPPLPDQNLEIPSQKEGSQGQRNAVTYWKTTKLIGSTTVSGKASSRTVAGPYSEHIRRQHDGE